jgi:hypothetical protein
MECGLMKSNLLKTLMVVGAILTMIGCGGSDSNTGNGAGNGDGPTSELPTNVEEAIDAPSSTLTQDLKDSITYMYSEEGLAYDVYMNIYKIQAVQQLQKIAENAEIRHIDAVNELAIKYDLNMTQYPDTDVPYSIDGIGNGSYPVDTVQYLYDLLYNKGIQSEKDALEVGCMVEVVDIDDLDKFIGFAEAANAADVLTVFNFLRDGSYSHYWAFDEGLKNMGVAEGCCSLDPALGHDFCHPEYPKEEKGNGGKGNK